MRLFCARAERTNIALIDPLPLSLPAGFLIPIAIMIVLSFPPLFGAEIIHLLCGVIWGLGVGFAIVAAGTLLGEIANF